MKFLAANLKTATYVGLWFVANVLTVILNKIIFQSLGFVYPLTLTVVHMATCTLGAVTVLRLVRPSMFVSLSWKDYLNGVVPLAVLFCANIVLGNVSLRWVPVSFMQTVKSSVPFFTVMIERLFFGVPQADVRIYWSLIPIVGGVMLATYTEVNFNVTGFLAAVIASIMTGFFANLSSKLMKTRLDSVNLLYYMSPISLGLLLPAMWASELDPISTYWETYIQSNVVPILIISGCIALALNVMTFLVINNTSALTYTVIGNIKVIFSILFSVLIFRNEIGIFNAIGCAITIGGAWWYSNIQHEIRTRRQKEQQQQSITVSVDSPHKEDGEKESTR